METVYDYGSRAGFWRLHRLFTGLDVPVTVYGVATALMRGPAQVDAMREAEWEIASHGLKWTTDLGFGIDAVPVTSNITGWRADGLGNDGAFFKAGASFTPSPVIEAMSPLACKASTMRSLSSGETRA